MENAAFAGELAGNTELEELYRLDASEAEPEDEDEDDAEEDDGDAAEPDVVPHG